MNRKMEVFLLYLLLLAVAAVEILMKLPFWVSKGYSPFLFLWVFKAPLIILLMTWYVRNRFGKSKA